MDEGERRNGPEQGEGGEPVGAERAPGTGIRDARAGDAGGADAGGSVSSEDGSGDSAPGGFADDARSGSDDGSAGRAHGPDAGDFELARPAGSGGSAAGADDDFALPEPQPRAQPPVRHPSDAQSDPERPRPLHDSDAYSTPPYGQPGPWAPAPPVQHPAAAAVAPDAGDSAVAAPGPALPAESPVVAGPASAAEPAVAPVAASEPFAAPVSAAEPLSAGASAAAPHAAPGLASPAEPPVTPVPASASPPPPVPDPTSPAAPPAPPADPWHRYDPWARAAAAPLQQAGAGAVGDVQRRKRVRRGLVGGALLIALVSGLAGGVVGAQLERNGGIGAVELPQPSAAPSGRAPDSVAGIAARALPSVVTLHVTGSEESGTGTGFVLDEQGHILTNNHVVQPAGGDGAITVVFNGGQTATAEVVGRDSGYDLAVVRVTGVKGLTPLPLGNSDDVQVGDPVVAIGAPFDLEGTVTSGIISAKERPITAGGDGADARDVSYVDALQTDAPINPGNSGGPLLDRRGRVIGINSAIRSAGAGTGADTGQAGSIGLGFAIPVNQGKRVAEELINTGRATHPVIGITLDMGWSGDGARVGTAAEGDASPVTPGGPGARAGLRAGDVITEVDGQRVHSGEELIVRTRAHRPGDRLELTVERGGAERTLSLVLGSSK
ncbi:trypsin-like peptidase domain-containing protein [Streptomyces longwoodensis]|uniref:trypsin-like peptidase domain-containing protein n=1 Tax=Streptomyces longwoodensis TaxID=68231 RepID=UPI00382F9C6A